MSAVNDGSFFERLTYIERGRVSRRHANASQLSAGLILTCLQHTCCLIVAESLICHRKSNKSDLIRDCGLQTW